jgi:cobalt/nickel transport system permease protein
MHMADALLSPTVGLAMDAVGIAAIGLSVRGIRKDEFSERKIPIMGVAGAMVFAAQMINFAIPATGSSGHIGGGMLLAGLLGGFPAFLSITSILTIQCLFFADGGLLALGCNIFNMGIVPCLFVYPLVFRPLLKGGARAAAGMDAKFGTAGYRRLTAASAVSAALCLVIGAFCVVLQTTLSGITALPFGTFTALMLPIHLAIGIVEGAVTAAALCFVYRIRPEIIDSAADGGRFGGGSAKKVVALLAALVVVAGGVLSLFASANPDGLEWAIGKTTEITLGEETELSAQGVIHDGAANVQGSMAFLPDYAFASDPDNAAGTSISGLVGAGIMFALAVSVGLIIARTKRGKRAAPDG